MNSRVIAMGRIRRKWASEEDLLLKAAVSKAQENDRPLIWHEIAANIPGRTNKDCRKRWYGKTAAKVNKGAWTPSEDERLYDAVNSHGTKWSVVASDVGTRTGDQCSKRWGHTINPEIDHSAWTSKEDELLLDGVNRYGRNWQQITSIHFPRRTSLGAKNRYHLLCRKSNGARTYSKSKSTKVSGIVPADKDKLDNSFELDRSDVSDSGSEMDEESSEGDRVVFRLTHTEAANRQAASFGTQDSNIVQLDSGTSETDFVDEYVGENSHVSFGNGADVDKAKQNMLTSQYPPCSTLLDNSNYTSETLNPEWTQQTYSQGSAVAPPSSLEQDVYHWGTTQSVDDFIMNFSPSTKSDLFLDDQSILDTGLLFDPELESMLGIDLSHTDNASTGTSPASVSSNATSTTWSARTPLPPNAAVTSSTPEKRPGNTRRVTIQAVCLADELGKLVQAVTERAFSAVVSTDDQMSFDSD